MRRLIVVFAVIGMLAACRGPEDHRADTTVGATPVGLAGLSSVPPRPSRSPRPNIPFWDEPTAQGVAARVTLEPPPAGSSRLPFGDGKTLTIFEPAREAGLHWSCPSLRLLYATSEPAALQSSLRDALQAAGYATQLYPRVNDPPLWVMQATVPDRSHDVTATLSRADRSAALPYVLRIEFVQRCEG